MSDLSIRAAGMAASQPNWGQEQSAASEDAAPGSGGENGGTVEEGLIPITLGRRILRTETAGLAVLSWIMYLLEA